MKTFDVQKACEVQKRFVEERSYPHFAPTSGRCYNCGKNIYSEINHGDWSSGYPVERASKELITGCPHCNISYCE